MATDDLEPPRPRRIGSRGVVLLVVLAVVFAALVVAVAVQSASVHEAAERAARSFTAPPLEGVRTPAPAAAPVRVVAGGTAFGDATSRYWSRVESGAGAQLDVSVAVTSWEDAARRDAARVSRSTALLVLVPGAREADADPVRLATALTRAVADAKERDPDADVLLVVPPGSADGDDRLADVVRSSAALSESRYLDLRSTTTGVAEDQAISDAADRLAAVIAARLR